MTKLTIIMGLLASLSMYMPAQTISGSITGELVDAQHSAIPNGTVTLSEQEQKFTLTAKTDEAGRFVFTQIPPGTYTLSVEAAGFKKYDRTGIALTANEKLALGSVPMEVGALSERIEVTAQAVQL